MPTIMKSTGRSVNELKAIAKKKDRFTISR